MRAETRRRVTEDDLRNTKALITRSYGQFRQSVSHTPEEVCNSIGRTICERPAISIATAAAAGVALYGIISLMRNRTSGDKSNEGLSDPIRGDRSDFIHDMLSMIVPLVTPIIINSIQKFIGDSLTDKKHR